MSEWPFQLYLRPLPTHVRPSNGAYVLLISIWIRRDLKPLVSADAPIQQRNDNNGRHDRASIEQAGAESDANTFPGREDCDSEGHSRLQSNKPLQSD